jgi:tetraacyldisaccharide 4'-kinase
MANIPELQARFFPLLAPFAVLYGLGMRARARMLRARAFACPCPCVSVGNIAWGGTGKTPVVQWLMDWAAGRGVRAVVLSRGYKARLRRPPVVARAGHTAREVGDEPLMLARACPDIPVVVDPNRRRAAGYAQSRLAPDLFILDDGMQHLAVRRDLDLVLLRPEDLRGQWNRVIPAGSWREDASALDRAGAFLLRCPPRDTPELARELRARLAAPDKPVFGFFPQASGLSHVGTGRAMTDADAPSRPYLLLAAVAHPGQAAETAATFMGRPPEATVFRPDHHAYDRREIRALARGRRIVCTPKDAVKIRDLADADADIWQLHTRLVFTPARDGDPAFPDWWEEWWLRRRPGLRPGPPQ